MLKLRWIITDNLKEISLKEFSDEWNGIYGYFELAINEQIIGFCPDRELKIKEEWDENILYWLNKLLIALIDVHNNLKAEIELLSVVDSLK